MRSLHYKNIKQSYVFTFSKHSKHCHPVSLTNYILTTGATNTQVSENAGRAQTAAFSFVRSDYYIFDWKSIKTSLTGASVYQPHCVWLCRRFGSRIWSGENDRGAWHRNNNASRFFLTISDSPAPSVHDTHPWACANKSVHFIPGYRFPNFLLPRVLPIPLSNPAFSLFVWIDER